MRAAPLVGLLGLLLGCTIVGLPPVQVTGTVRSPDGQPIENATVALHMQRWAPLCCDRSGILQLTRTGPDGRYRFVAGADRDLQFSVETRGYSVIAIHEHFMGEEVWPIDAPLSAPLDLRLEPKDPTWEWIDHDCLHLCPDVELAECRRAAEFHYGDKTRCDAWRERFW